MSDTNRGMLDAMHALFYPKTVAVIGASRTRGKHGNTPIRFLQNCGFPGEIYPINPSGGEVEGLTCYASLADTPKRVDCALMVIPSAGTVQSVRDCAAAGVRNVVMGVTGFSELGTDEGRAREAEVKAIAKQSGMRLIGPNTNGIFNASAKLPLGYNTSHGDALTPGPISIAAHSGALFNGVAPRLRQFGAGLSKYVAVGTEADLNVLDFLEYYIEDEDTGVIGLILEAIADGARFRQLAERARAAGKPIVALKLGRSVAGAGATVAHSTRLAGSARAYDALFEECRVASVPSVEALAGGCAVLLSRKVSVSKTQSDNQVGEKNADAAVRNRALVCIATTGGGSSLLADYAESRNMPLAGEPGGSWGGKVAEYIASIDTAGLVRNPLDSSTLGGHDRMTPFFQAQEADGFDGPVAVYTHMLPNPKMSELIAAHMVARKQRTGAPIVVVVPGGLSPELEAIYRTNGIPLFYDASTCFDSLSCHYQTLDELVVGGGANPMPSVAKAKAALSKITPLLASKAPGTVLSEWDSAEVLREAGVPMVESRVVASLDAALAAAKDVAYPVVLKALAPGVAHKNKMGFVIAGVADDKALLAAYTKLEVAVSSQGFKRDLVPFILQPMKPSKAELIVGVSSEQSLGHFLVVGLGGIYTEALNESRLFPIPVAPAAMKKRLSETRLGHLLSAIDAGRSAGAPSAMEGVLRALDALQRLILAYGDRIESIDVNPLLVGEAGCVAVDALVVLKGGA
ncbi:MAG: acetate--CoA ligase family protein [Burkholderiales bacterium]